MNRGVDRQAIFFTDRDREAFLTRLAVTCEEHEVVVLAYCLMGNHFHLLVQVTEPDVLPAAMHQLTSSYSHRVNARRGRDGPLVRGRYHSIPVETDGYLLTVTRYIHRNPCDLPYVRRLQEYRYSSYPAYIGLAPTPAFLDPAPVTALLGGRRAAVEAHTEGGSVERWAGGGGLPVALSSDDLRLLVDCAVAVEDLTHPAADGARQGLARAACVLLADRVGDPTLRARFGEVLGDRSPRAAVAALRRARQREADDPVLRRTVAWVEDALHPRRLPLSA